MELLFHGAAGGASGLREYRVGKDFHVMKDADRYRLLAFPIPSLYRPKH
jgi:hypothetical protein